MFFSKKKRLKNKKNKKIKNKKIKKYSVHYNWGKLRRYITESAEVSIRQSQSFYQIIPLTFIFSDSWVNEGFIGVVCNNIVGVVPKSEEEENKLQGKYYLWSL